MTNINDKRKIIDDIDDNIINLYKQRMNIVADIAIEKANSGIRVRDKEREDNIIKRVASNVDDNMKVYAKLLFENLFESSRAYQAKFIMPVSEMSKKIKDALKKEFIMPIEASVCCQGVKGSYASLTADRLFEIPNITYVKTFSNVFEAVGKGLCQYGVLPIENSTVGSVNAVYDLMKEHECHIVKSVKMPINHCLLGVAGVNIDDVKEIYSHEQAISQCAGFIEKMRDVKVHVCSNTAVAAEMVATKGDKSIVAIASREAGENFGLKIIESAIQDNKNNYTRFVCITKDLRIIKGANRISLMINLPHTQGSLSKILQLLNVNRINLTKLESRPIGNSDFEFMFYFDFVADISNDAVINMLEELQNGVDRLIFLGAYIEE